MEEATERLPEVTTGKKVKHDINKVKEKFITWTTLRGYLLMFGELMGTIPSIVFRNNIIY